MKRTLLILALLSGCETVRATTLPTPKDRVTECEALCTELGMNMSALVIIMSSAGCVCEKPRSTAGVRGASAVSGGALIAATAAAAQQQQQQAVRR